jgi:hypothetical protein
MIPPPFPLKLPIREQVAIHTGTTAQRGRPPLPAEDQGAPKLSPGASSAARPSARLLERRTTPAFTAVKPLDALDVHVDQLHRAEVARSHGARRLGRPLA